MYELNGIMYSIKRTWSFQGEFDADPRDGQMCVELHSADGRYKVMTDMDSFTKHFKDKN